MAHSVAEVSNAEGKPLGSVRIADTASGELHVIVDLKDLPPGGVHAIHIHEFGKCEPPTFESAGGHLAGGKKHGAMDPGGQHQGDLPNVTVAADGTAKVEFFTNGVKVADVTDADGGAIVVHAKPDDYTSQPSGAAGDRIACGVFAAAK
ncbi:superoxide dismutase family protein [Paracoccus suum]|uniref:Superoxide dismutase family protein n=2 Tax=Paracoccus suum TaxID=2259340 RepID=A0A344PMV7_9RHOB|nr:superoxide dismutase family protein [Paracoccus suum]